MAISNGGLKKENKLLEIKNVSRKMVTVGNINALLRCRIIITDTVADLGPIEWKRGKFQAVTCTQSQIGHHFKTNRALGAACLFPGPVMFNSVRYGSVLNKSSKLNIIV